MNSRQVALFCEYFVRAYLKYCVYKVVLQSSIPAQIYHVILDMSNH